MNLINIFNNNLKRSMNKRLVFLVTILFPIIVVILGILANYISKPSFNIGILNDYKNEQLLSESEKRIYDNTIIALKNTQGINVEIADLKTVKTDIITGKYSAVIHFNKSDFKLYSVKDKNTNDILKYLIERYKKDPTPIDISELEENTLGILQRIIAFIVLFLMITSTVTASMIIKDKNSGTFTRVLYSPQNIKGYVLGNMLYNFTITYFQYLVSISIIKLFNVDIGMDYIDLVCLGILVSALATSFGTFVSSLFNKEMYANLFSTCIALIVSLIGGSFIPIEKMPTMLQNISIISPIRWFISFVTYVEERKGSFFNMGYIFILIAMTLVLSLLAMKFIQRSKYLSHNN
ncbi:ABC transporter permease [Clostridioides sp. GD02404]|uniref:ABC transporter permease n=1 Tax=Clostridioides sp. GD02404 TaxID=3054354 RepID=UPI0038AFDCC2